MTKYLTTLLLIFYSLSISLCQISQKEIVKEGAMFEGIQFQKGNWEKIKALAKTSGKNIFIDGYTTWCVPCKQMDKEVFSKKEVGDIYNKNFVCWKIDMETEEGIVVKDHYEVAAFPTFLFVDADGTLLHKTVGKQSVYKFNETGILVTEGKGLASVENNYAEDNSFEYLNELLEALKAAYETERINEVVIGYFKTIKPEKLIEEKNYSLLKEYLTDINAEAFIYFDEHRVLFADKYGQKEIDQKILVTYNQASFPFIKTNKDAPATIAFEEIKKYRNLLEERGVPERNKLNAFLNIRIYRAENKWDDFVSEINNSIEKEYYKNPNDLEYYNFAFPIQYAENPSKEALWQSAEWMQTAFDISTNNIGYKIVYLKNKLKILERLNEVNEIQKLKKTIQEIEKK